MSRARAAAEKNTRIATGGSRKPRALGTLATFVSQGPNDGSQARRSAWESGN
jgi:hypothetical protein